MTKEIVIDIESTGKVESMHFDEFDLGFLGLKSISRASEILFNADTQDWFIILPDLTMPECDCLKGFDSYEVAREFEVEWLQRCRKSQVDPLSVDGLLIASTIRDKS